MTFLRTLRTLRALGAVVQGGAEGLPQGVLRGYREERAAQLEKGLSVKPMTYQSSTPCPYCRAHQRCAHRHPAQRREDRNIYHATHYWERALVVVCLLLALGSLSVHFLPYLRG